MRLSQNSEPYHVSQHKIVPSLPDSPKHGV
jgi:hypothetical protein